MLFRSTINSRSHSPTGLLSLPLELRQQIYSLLLPLEQAALSPLNRYSCKICGNVNNFFSILFRRLYSSNRGQHSWVICEHTSRQPSIPIGLLALRTANSQLYHEITSFSAVNWVPKKLENSDKLMLQRAVIGDTAAFKLCSQPWVLNIMRQASFRQEVVAVEIHLSAPALYPRFVNPLFRLIKGPAGKLQNLAAVLAIYSHLRTVIITASSIAVLSGACDPLGDTESFLPLVERGVRVTFWADCTYASERDFERGIKGSWKEMESKEMEWRRAFDEIIKRKKATDVATAKGRIGSGVANRSVEWTDMASFSIWLDDSHLHYQYLPMWKLSLVGS